jgi:UDP-3-O-[3-hydroxymyristoyl] glucosamine N-acyltransferase
MKTELSHLAQIVGGEIVGDPQKCINDAAPFETAAEDHITVAGNQKFLKMLNESKAGAIIVPQHVDSDGHNLLQVANPLVAFAKVIAFFHPPSDFPVAIHPRAEIGENFSYGDDVSVGPAAAIGNNVSIGNRVRLYPGVVIGDEVTLGDDVTVYPNVTIMERSIVGNRVVIHAGAVIGSDGFGFAPDEEGYYKIPHTGIVQVDDDVEIGANNTIDRATFGKTRIRSGVKTDNLVHIAHNVSIGENTVIVAQVGISGSVTIGKHAILAGQAGIADHLTIGDNAIIGPRSGIVKDVPAGQALIGAPGTPPKLYYRIQRIISRLPDLKKRIEALEKKLHKKDL